MAAAAAESRTAADNDVRRPWRNGMDVTRSSADKWIVDFGWTMSEAQAALYEAPFEFAYEIEAEPRPDSHAGYR